MRRLRSQSMAAVLAETSFGFFTGGSSPGRRSLCSSVVQPTFSSSSMGKHGRVLVCGQKASGKTSILRQAAYGNFKFDQDYIPTIEDTYVLRILTDRGTQETVLFFDTAGLDQVNTELSRHYFTFPDAYVLVFAVNDADSFNRVDRIKKEIDKLPKEKDRLDVPIIVLANKVDLAEKRVVDSAFAQNWAQREKVRLFEVSAADRESLLGPFIHLASRLFPSQKEPKFSLVKKRDKVKQPGAAIVMDI